jgi:CheY-like chemotaxis protein
MVQSGPTTVLVADDSHGHRKLVEMLLSAHNYEVVAVENGHDAITYLHANTPRFAILDINMPYMTGIEVCAKAKRIARLRPLPFIIMTSMVDEDTRTAAYQAGADLVIHKPLAGQSLAEILKEAQSAAADRVAAATYASGDSPSSSPRL